MAVRIRRAAADDVELLWRWRNDPLVRQNSFNSDPITWAEHEVWYPKQFGSSDMRIYILEKDGKPLAQVRYERRDNLLAEIGDISVDEGERGKGYGKSILVHTADLACKELKAHKLLAVVKAGNLASERAFQSAGFNFQQQITKRGCACHQFIYICSDQPVADEIPCCSNQTLE
jgi:RimJ/RimL family protein N-acetyltransferase